jgi:asparagine synthase (glutamine-hydrolysing)
MQKTFTASIDEPALDEKRFAEEMIRHTNVNGYFVYPSAQGLWREIDEFLHYHDNICKSTNIYAGWCVMRLASKHVKVVLNGQGSDELFGGYPRYEMIYLADMLKRGSLRSLSHFLAGQKSRYGNVRALNNFLMGGYLAVAPSFLKVYLFKQKNKIQWECLQSLFNENTPHKDSFDRMTQWTSSLNRQLWWDVIQGYLRQLLYHDDRNASAFSIENRVPFLDHRLVDYVSSIPSVYKIYNGWSKWLLRLAMRELLPEQILWRKDKIGFTTPSAKWATCENSPILPLISRYGIKEYSTHYLWKFYIAHRLMNLK